MKTLLLLISLSAVAVGQTTSATSKSACQAWPSRWDCPKPKPHKPKPSVKKVCLYGCELDFELGAGSGKNMFHEIPADPCDGLACTGPVEMLSPGKSAVPVDLSGGDDIQRERVQSVNEPADVAYAVLKCNPGIHSCDMKEAVKIGGIDSTVVKLADNEYFHLKSLRTAVVKEEKRLAVKYGANRGLNFNYCSGDMSAMKAAGCFSDNYEFHGQFLLIERGGK
jgi:hypothetical protein